MNIAIILLLSITAVLAEESAVQEFTNGNNLLSAAIYKELLKTNKGNFVVSPFSVETILALVEQGAGGETAEQLKTGLNLPKTRPRIDTAFKTVLLNFNNKSKDYQLLTANKVYVNKGFTINKNFQQIARIIFKSEVEEINFSEKVKSANEINKWVEDQTNSKIKQLISPNTLDGLKALLVNTLYFNGTWENPFPERNTNKNLFYKSKNETVLVDTMHLTRAFSVKYCQELNATFVNLPYKGGNISMTLVLPFDDVNLADIEGKIEQILKTQKYSNALTSLSLPKFKIETTIPFVPILRELGIKDAFDDKADFNGITTKPEHLAISNVVQKTFVNITENGTEAAAVTTVSLVTTGLRCIIPPIIRIIEFNRPFLFYIGINDIILFVGRVTNPLE